MCAAQSSLVLEIQLGWNGPPLGRGPPSHDFGLPLHFCYFLFSFSQTYTVTHTHTHTTSQLPRLSSLGRKTIWLSIEKLHLSSLGRGTIWLSIEKLQTYKVFKKEAVASQEV